MTGQSTSTDIQQVLSHESGESLTFETIEDAGAVQQANEPLAEKTMDGDTDESAS